MTVKAVLSIFADKCKGCGLCTLYCPKGILELDTKINRSGYNPVIVTDLDKCSGCGNCYLICPDLAIEVERRGKNE